MNTPNQRLLRNLVFGEQTREAFDFEPAATAFCLQVRALITEPCIEYAVVRTTSDEEKPYAVWYYLRHHVVVRQPVAPQPQDFQVYDIGAL